MPAPRSRLLVAASELALPAVTLATAAAFSRLFVDRSFLPPVAAAVVASHAVAAATRRLRWGIGPSALGSLGALALALSWFVYPATTTAGVPTSATWEALSADAGTAWRTFQDVVAPAPVETGFVVALLAALWVAAFLSDWAAFRLWSPVEAAVPATALFLFAALLGAPHDEVRLTGLFVGTLLAFQLLAHVTREFGSRHWINADAEAGGRRLVLAGTGMGLLAVVAAVVAGPALPGATAPPVVEWRDLGDDSPARVTVSPMVSIRSQLVNQPDVRLFSVEADEAAYWRLTGLDTFDGDIWKSSGSFNDVDRSLPRLGPADLPGERVLTQRFTIERLGQLWLPAAFEPVQVDAGAAALVYEPETSTLIVANDRPDSDGLSYEVTSVDPTLPREVLEREGPVPDDIAERFLALPDDFDPALAAEAERVTAAGRTDYERALLLQEWFQTEFRYNLDVEVGQSIDGIHTFLEVREGYCQQFAGTFAAFARSLGIPSRVAVGFTWGDPDPDRPGRFLVSGRNAHAWPEVWLPGPGWVPFEPTPGRGNPQATEITGRPAAQEPPPGGTGDPPPSAPTTAPVPTPSISLPEPVDAGPALDTGDGTGAATDGADRPGLAERLVAPVAVVAVAGGLYAAGVLALRTLARRRRLARLLAGTGGGAPDGTPGAAQRARMAWFSATEALAVAGLRRRSSETPHEFCGRVRRCTGVAPGALATLADLEAAATYGVAPPAEREVVLGEEAATEVGRWVRRTTSRWERAWVALDPRSLLPRRQQVVSG